MGKRKSHTLTVEEAVPNWFEANPNPPNLTEPNNTPTEVSDASIASWDTTTQSPPVENREEASPPAPVNYSGRHRHPVGKPHQQRLNSQVTWRGHLGLTRQHQVVDHYQLT